MTTAFIDTNIIIDLLINRQPFSKSAIAIFNAAEKNQIALYTPSHAIATTHYVLKKYNEEKNLRRAISSLLDYVKPIAVNESILRKALHSEINDFEDAIQMMTAITNDQISMTITRNIKDFKKSILPVFTADQALEKINSF